MLLCSPSVSPCAAEHRGVSSRSLASPGRAACGRRCRRRGGRDLQAERWPRSLSAGRGSACRVRVNWRGAKQLGGVSQVSALCGISPAYFPHPSPSERRSVGKEVGKKQTTKRRQPFVTAQSSLSSFPAPAASHLLQLSRL